MLLLSMIFLLALPILILLSAKTIACILATAILIALVIVGIGHWRRRHRGEKAHIWPRLWRTTLLSVLILGALAGVPVYWLIVREATHPLLLPQVTLSNGATTVVFQGMVHVGSEGFYKSLVYDLENALTNGYKLYYEGLKNSTPEADAWFSKQFAGGNDLGTNYKALARNCGLQYQIDYFQLLVADMRAHPDRHLTADVDTQELKAEYDRLMATDKKFSAALEAEHTTSSGEGESFDPMAKLMRWTEASPSHQTLGGILCRGFFTVALTSHLESKAEGHPLDRLLLDFRNRHLADTIAAEVHPRIFVTYGAEHFRGVFQLLKEKDPRWRIQSVKWARPISTPEHYEKALVLD